VTHSGSILIQWRVPFGQYQGDGGSFSNESAISRSHPQWSHTSVNI